MKLVPTFKSHKATRNCKWCMFFWSMLIMFWSLDSMTDEIVFKFILAEISKQRGFYSEYINLYSDIIIATQNKNEAIKILKNDNSFFQQNSKLKLFEFLGKERLNTEELVTLIKFSFSEKENADFIILYDFLSGYITNNLSNYKIRELLEKISKHRTKITKKDSPFFISKIEDLLSRNYLDAFKYESLHKIFS